ncbi:MAG: hypothetical protein RL616_2227 [Verrucomicrobiota bacterium]|jgi:hypothetical protein
MPLTVQQIVASKSDKELLGLMSAELEQHLGRQISNDALVKAIQTLPTGLRAMAATHRLDVSMAINDLGWHFHNHPHRELCAETSRGLRELEAFEIFEIFESARSLIEPHWEKLASFASWYETSGVEAAMRPLNQRLWKICSQSPEYGLMQFWLSYARSYPERVAD